jgi:hypothetical protein
MEHKQPFAMNQTEFLNLRERKLAELIQRRGPDSAGTESQTDAIIDDSIILEELRRRGLRISSMTELVPRDEYDRELGAISDVLAYFEIAVERISDYVPMFIAYEFMEQFSEELREGLCKNLGLTGVDGVKKCADFVKDDPDNRKKRDALLAKRVALSDAIATWRR